MTMFNLIMSYTSVNLLYAHGSMFVRSKNRIGRKKTKTEITKNEVDSHENGQCTTNAKHIVHDCSADVQ